MPATEDHGLSRPLIFLMTCAVAATLASAGQKARVISGIMTGLTVGILLSAGEAVELSL